MQICDDPRRLTIERHVRQVAHAIQRVWRIVEDIADTYPKSDAARPATFSPEAETVRKAAHRALDQVGKAIETLRFNVAVAHVHEFTNVLQTALTKPAGGSVPAGLDERRRHPSAA